MRAMRSTVLVAAVAAALGAVGSAEAAPTQRKKVDQKGDFVVIGNTLGHDCATTNALPVPVVGMVGACGMNVNDTSADVFWRADTTTATASTAITGAEARSTAVLALPANATVTYARVYWSASFDGTADNTAVIDRVGTADAFTQNLTGDIPSVTVTSAPRTYYQSSAEITTLVQQHGAGPYRLGGVNTVNLVNFDSSTLYSAWWMVVFYTLNTDPVRNLVLFDGLDIVQQGAGNNNITVNLTGFLVPNAGFDAKLGVLAYEGDDSITGDSLQFNNVNLTNGALNPTTNFFNGTRSGPLGAVSVVGDLPQLTGAARSQSGFDMDVVNVTPQLMAGQTTATIEATTGTDFYILGGFVTSISTIKPDFTSTTKTFVNETRAAGVQPGDTLKYTISTTNNGNDPGVPVVMTDALPMGITFVPGSIEVTAGPNMGMKSDVAGDDQAEYTAGNRTITVRLGTGANMTVGGTIGIGETSTITFKVTVDGNAMGTISNQAVINSAGQSGAPSTPYNSDGNGPAPGTPPTDVILDTCQKDGDCPAGKFCFMAAHPFVCGDCRTNADCPMPTRPVCDMVTHTCRPCTMNSDCSGSTPVCETASGRCVQCQTSMDCSGLTPLCVTSTGLCGPCTGDGPIGGCIDPSRPACNTQLPLAGACTECSMTNVTKCGGNKPICVTQVGLCGCTDKDGDSECGGNLSGVICNGPVGICTPGCSEAPMRNRCQPPQQCLPPGGAVGVCNVPPCLSDLNCQQPRPKCDTAATPRTCVGCLLDTDCAAGYVCDSGASKTCVECTATKTQNCVATNAGNRCLVNLTCGCAVDSECGTNISGRVCDNDVSKCTYGCRGTGGNGCPVGLICSSTDNKIGRCMTPGAADAGVMPDAAPDAAPDVAPDAPADLAVAVDVAADAPADMAEMKLDLAPSPDFPPPPDTAPLPPLPDAAVQVFDDAGVPRGLYVAGGGCQCETGHGGSQGTGLWVALLLPVALLLRRRRR
jgi:uncharacterized repeat protein (TIGR01451 family)/MYXO-CTERM domain-containing protein